MPGTRGPEYYAVRTNGTPTAIIPGVRRILGELEPGKTGCIKAFAIVPSNWEQLKIKYTPYFAKSEARVFVLKRANKI